MSGLRIWLVGVMRGWRRLLLPAWRGTYAARMVGRSDMRYATSNVPRQPVEQKLHDTLLHELQVAMPVDELSRLMKEGEVLSDEVAVRLALRD
jgi:hypothetical protein